MGHDEHVILDRGLKALSKWHAWPNEVDAVIEPVRR